MSNPPIQYCQKCCYPSNHALHLGFNDQQVCTGCIIHEEKDNTDWQQKFEQLKQLIKPYQSNHHYDCIVPVSGGQDSFFIVHVVTKLLKLTPLLVSYNRMYNTRLGIANLENLRTRFGCDLISFTPKPASAQRLAQQMFLYMGSFHWPYLAGHTVFPVQMAVKFKIPLIIWGAHQGIDQVGMFSHHDQVEMTRRYRKEHDLLGVEAEDMVDVTPQLNEALLAPLFYPSDRQLLCGGVRGIYLNNFIRWDSKAQHEQMIKLYGYQTLAQARTFDYYHDIHDRHYNQSHDYIKWIKFGYTKVTDQVCREIRLKRLSREQGFDIIRHFGTQIPQDAQQLCQWLDISEKDYTQKLNSLRNDKVWRKTHDGYALQHWIQPNHALDNFVNPIPYKQTDIEDKNLISNEYRTLPRGFAQDFNPAHNELMQKRETVC